MARIYGWKLITHDQLPRDGLHQLEVKFSHEKNAPSKIVQYDRLWGNGRGGWFTQDNHAIKVDKVVKWRIHGASVEVASPSR